MYITTQVHALYSHLITPAEFNADVQRQLKRAEEAYSFCSNKSKMLFVAELSRSVLVAIDESNDKYTFSFVGI